MTNKKNDCLYYPNTDTEIKLGDRVMFPKWFKKKPGTVVYIPGQSKLNKNMEYGDVKLWAIQLDDKPNDVLTMGYFPPNDVVPKKLEFLSRGDGVNRIDENEEIN